MCDAVSDLRSGHRRIITAPLLGSIVSVAVAAGRARQARRHAGRHRSDEDGAPRRGALRPASCARCIVAKGDVVDEGQPLFEIDADADRRATTRQSRTRSTSTTSAPICKPSIDAHAFTLDANRPDAVAKRRKTGMRTARENVDDLLDPGSFIEYGALAVAAQRARRSLDDLEEEHAGGRTHHRPRHRQRRAHDARQGARRADGLRLHRARRHAGQAQSQEERPHPAGGRRLEDPVRDVRRGRRRAAGRYRCSGRRRPRLHDLQHVRAPLRRGAARRHRRRLLLRRQRGAARLRRCDHRDAERVDRHGRTGDDRGRRPRRRRARRRRPRQRAGAERRDRYSGRGRSGGRRGGEAVSRLRAGRPRAGTCMPTSARCAI